MYTKLRGGDLRAGGIRKRCRQPDTKRRWMAVFTTIKADGTETVRRDMGVIILKLACCVNKVPRLRPTLQVS